MKLSGIEISYTFFWWVSSLTIWFLTPQWGLRTRMVCPVPKNVLVQSIQWLLCLMYTRVVETWAEVLHVAASQFSKFILWYTRMQHSYSQKICTMTFQYLTFQYLTASCIPVCYRSCIWHFNTWQFHVYQYATGYVLTFLGMIRNILDSIADIL